MIPEKWFQAMIGLAIGAFISTIIHYRLGNFKLAFILLITSAILALLSVALPKEDKDE